MGKCDITGGILGLGFNKFAERQGLKPLPRRGRPGVRVEPGIHLQAGGQGPVPARRKRAPRARPDEALPVRPGLP